MADYQKMYSTMFNAATNAINILRAAQVEAEEMYIDHEPANITLIHPDVETGDDGDSEDGEV